MKKIYELADNRYLSISIIEIISVPEIDMCGMPAKENVDRNQKFFQQFLNELYQLGGINLVYEIFWVTDKVENQPIKSKIHLYVVLRMIGDKKDSLAYELDNITDDVLTTLNNMHFYAKVVQTDDASFQSLVQKVDDSTLFCVAKREKYSANSRSIYPYYYGEVIAGQNLDDLSNLVTTLSQHTNCCISFQLFPTKFLDKERYILSELSTELKQISSGIMQQGQFYKDPAAEEPSKVYSYYNLYQNSPLFLYNILVFGERNTCANIATKIMSLLQNGSTPISQSEYMCLDLSKENIDLKDCFPNYVWNINSKLLYVYRNQKIRQLIPISNTMFRLPYIVTAEEAVSFFRLPLYKEGMIALQSAQKGQVTEQFSETVVADNNIKLGKIFTNGEKCIAIGCSEKAFTKHVLIVGTPGSGKTTFSINLLLQFARRKIPFLAIEPTKTEYRAMIDAIEDLQIFTPGNSDVSPFVINPFIPPKGIQIEQYIPSLASAFKAAFSMPSPLDMIFFKAIRNCYIKYGWKDYSKYGDSDVEVFGLYEFILVFKEMVKDTNYSNEVRGNIESAGLLRLMNLIEQNSNIYDSIHTVPLEDILSKPTVLELNAIENAEQKSLIMALLLINICIYTKNNQIGDGELKNVILIDEAHVLLEGNSLQNAGQVEVGFSTVKALQDMIAEIRSYGTSIIIADQSPTKVSREVVANTDIKVSFRLVQATEKALIADSSNMDDKAQEYLAKLKPGEAYVYYSQLEKPQLVVTEDIRAEENIRLSVSNTEIAKRTTYWQTNKDLLKPYSDCKYCEGCKAGCDFRLRANAEYIANITFSKLKKDIKNVEDVKKCVFYIPQLAKSKFEKYSEEERKRLQICARIKLLRKIQMEFPFKLSNTDKQRILRIFPKEE